MAEAGGPTAPVSWAHRDPKWSDHQAEEWISQVVQFATLLMANGVDTSLDLWSETDPQIDWTRWGQLQVQNCQLVIVLLQKLGGSGGKELAPPASVLVLSPKQTRSRACSTQINLPSRGRLSWSCYQEWGWKVSPRPAQATKVHGQGPRRHGDGTTAAKDPWTTTTRKTAAV